MRRFSDRFLVGSAPEAQMKGGVMEQAEFRMPATGESWRDRKIEMGPYPSHESSGLMTIIGIAHDAVTGAAMVVYTHYGWGLIQLPPLYVISLADFMAKVPDDRGRRAVPRFHFEGERGDDKRCPFIRDEPELMLCEQYDRMVAGYDPRTHTDPGNPGAHTNSISSPMRRAGEAC